MIRHKKVLVTGTLLVVIIATGTVGYWLIGERQYSWLNCLYMTVITISTIGYGEIIDLSGSAAGRLFTMVIALCGIGALAYMLSNFTAFVVEGELKEVFQRRKMEKRVSRFKDHHIVCGVVGPGFYVIEELFRTHRNQAIVDLHSENIAKVLETVGDLAFIVGDATDNNTLLKAGIKEAKGLFAVTGDDNQNLVISLTAKQLNPEIRVVARCKQLKNVEKMKRAGADAVVSPTYIGGLRMASEMTRPEVVSFLDVMLRDKEKSLRIEEVAVPGSWADKPIAALNLKHHRDILLIAVKTGDGWVYNPPEEYLLPPQGTLIFLGNPEGRQRFEKAITSR